MKTKTYLSLLLIISISLNSFTQIDFGPQQVITTNADYAYDVYACDIDGDGDMDVLSASYLDGKIAWYENTDGVGTFGTQQVIDIYIGSDWGIAVYACDIDGDSDMDVISGGSEIAWYENTDGLGTFGSQQIIVSNVYGVSSVYACDIDGDDDNDVLATSVITTGTNKIIWHENTDGAGTFGPQQVITTDVVWPNTVYACDIDGDSDMDALSSSSWDNKIAWYKNTDGAGTFSSQQIITTDAIGASDVYACDIDGDGDMDVLSASSGDDKIAWYENTDGEGTFGTQQVITTAVDASSVYSANLDGDGDIDVLSAGDNKIAYYENTDGNGSFGTQQVITTNANGANSVYSADLDDDGAMDVLSASCDDNKIAWYENLSPIGVNQNKLVDFSIFPNPTTGVLTIQAEFTITQIEIYNQLGQLVSSNTDKNTIDISTVSQGLYFCKIKDDNGNTGTRKVVKE